MRIVSKRILSFDIAIAVCDFVSRTNSLYDLVVNYIDIYVG